MKLYSRKCNVCGGHLLSQPMSDVLRHNCFTLGDHVACDLPELCWQNLSHPFAIDVLSTIPSYRQRDATSGPAHQRRVSLALDVIEATSNYKSGEDVWRPLLEKHGHKAIKRFFGALPVQSALRPGLESYLSEIDRGRVTLLVKTKKQKQIDKIVLSEDFERALQMFTDASQRRLELKHQRGHEYSPATVKHRIGDARRFCEFLMERGLQFWPEVSQHNLDDYVDTVNRSAGKNAFTFLAFVRGHFRLTQKFIRPKVKRKPPVEAILEPELVRNVLLKVIRHQSLQVVVAALFLALYAQTIARSSKLRCSDFRRQSGKLQANFAEQWTPLDNLTEKFLCQLWPEFMEHDFVGKDEPLLSNSYSTLKSKTERLVGVPLKPLRLAAIANILRSGITDRGYISRILGVSMPTVAYVEGSFQWDLQSTVPSEIVEARNEVIRGERTE